MCGFANCPSQLKSQSRASTTCQTYEYLTLLATPAPDSPQLRLHTLWDKQLLPKPCSTLKFTKYVCHMVALCHEASAQAGPQHSSDLGGENGNRLEKKKRSCTERHCSLNDAVHAISFGELYVQSSSTTLRGRWAFTEPLFYCHLTSKGQHSTPCPMVGNQSISQQDSCVS